MCIRKRLPHRIHPCILAHSSSGRLLTPRSSPPHGALRELRCPSRRLSHRLEDEGARKKGSINLSIEKHPKYTQPWIDELDSCAVTHT